MQNLSERVDPDSVEMVKSDVTDVGHLVDTSVATTSTA